MRCVLMIAALAPLFAASAEAADAPAPAQSLATCAAITADAQRLQCYDNLAKAQAAPGAEAGWKLYTATNPVDDSKTVALQLAASNQQSRFGEPILLTLRCAARKTAAYIEWRSFLGEMNATMTVRFGNEKAVTQNWGLSADKTAAFAPGDATAFIRHLAKVDQLVAQTTPYSQGPVTAIFKTAGLAAAAAPLAQNCGWKM